MTKSLLAAAALAAITLSAAEAAIGQSWNETPRRATADIRGLDLTTRTGRRTLGYRINLAVTDVCGMAQALDLPGRRLEMICRTRAWGAARPQVIAAVLRARRPIIAIGAIAVSDPRGAAPVVVAIATKPAPVATPVVATVSTSAVQPAAETLTTEEAADIFRFAGSR